MNASSHSALIKHSKPMTRIAKTSFIVSDNELMSIIALDLANKLNEFFHLRTEPPSSVRVMEVTFLEVPV